MDVNIKEQESQIRELPKNRVIDLPQFRPQSTIKNHENSVDALELVPKSTKFVSAAFDGTFCLWDINKHKNPSFQLDQEKYHQSIQNVKFLPNEPNLCQTSGNDPNLGVVDLRQESFVKQIKNKDLDKMKTMYHMFLMIDSKLCLFTCCWDGKVKQFAVDHGKNTLTLTKTQDAHNSPCNHCAVSYDNKYLISTSSDLKVALHDLKTGKLVDEHKVSEPITLEEEIDPDNIEELRIRIPKTQADFKEQREQANQKRKINKNKPNPNDPSYIWSCEFLNGSTYKFISSCNNAQVKMFDIVDAKLTLVKTQIGHTHRVRHISMLPDNEHFCTCSTDSTVRIWKFDKTVEAATQLTGFRDFVSNCLWVDNTTCIGSSWDSIINFYKIDWDHVKSWPLHVKEKVYN